jgi:hypothetical protein
MNTVRHTIRDSFLCVASRLCGLTGSPHQPGTSYRSVHRYFVALCSLACTLALAADPKPPLLDPGPAGPPANIPSDAIIIFDGKDLSKWRTDKTNAAAWKLENGYMEVNGTGSIFTREEFGDIQLHVEWASPTVVKGDGQGRGNSGVYLMGRYEIQVLDCYGNETYPNGQTAAFYGNAAPLANACRKPGEWQTYEIVFHVPKQRSDGMIEAGSFTVFHNGVLVQDHIPIKGDSTTAAPFKGIAPHGPLMLQDHGNPVRFRNVWLRKL